LSDNQKCAQRGHVVVHTVRVASVERTEFVRERGSQGLRRPAVVTGAVGVGGIIFTWLTGKQARDAARVDARQARNQERLESTYTDLLVSTERISHWLAAVFPVLETGQPIPEPPSPAEQARTEALVKAFGSNKIRELMEAWRGVVQQATTRVGLIPEVEQDRWRWHGIPEDPRQKLEELRQQEREAREALADQAAVELRHRR
jgi:hypothetical protein